MFIAMLNNTFQRVYDRSKDVAEMQLAEIVFGIEETLSPKDLKAHREYIDKISPEKLPGKIAYESPER